MILMHDFRAEPPDLRDAMAAAARRVLDSGRYVLGPEVEALEARWAALCGMRHAIGVANGLDAIEIALRAQGIGRGDEVIVPAMTAFATVLAVLRAGADPVLADIEPESALLSLASATRCVSPRTKAVVLVHLYGQLRDMQAWVEFCAGHELSLVEDCAQSHLAAWGGRTAGAFGRAGAYSFYPTKNLGAPGDAGMIVCDDGGIARAAARLRNYGQEERFVHPEAGLNSRLDEIQAAMLLERLRWLGAFNERRNRIAAAYRGAIAHPAVTLLAAPQESGSHVHHLFVVRTGKRDALQAHLHGRGVESSVHYPLPIHQQDPCANVRRDPRGLAHSERHAATCLSLPCHPQMDEAQVARVIESVNSLDG